MSKHRISEEQTFIEVWDDGYLAGDIAEKLTCIVSRITPGRAQVTRLEHLTRPTAAT